MRRLLTTLGCDLKLQWRNGFYAAAAFVALCLVLPLRYLPEEARDRLLPPLVLTNMLVNTFYFIGGLVLLEKEEGTLSAQVVTPLRSGEYLASKIVTLTGLSLLEALLIVLASRGGAPNLWALALGVALTGAVYSLYGFVVVARYDAINEYLFPSLLYTSVLSLPLLPYFGLWESPWFYLHPVQAPLLLLQAAFQPIAAWQWLYGLGYGALWTGLAFAAGRRSFERFVTLGAGGP